MGMANRKNRPINAAINIAQVMFRSLSDFKLTSP